jgi:spore germination protein KB
MLEQGKISNIQFMLLIIISRLMLTVTYLSYIDSPPWNQDAWISDLLSFPMHIFLVIPIYSLAKLFPQLTIIESAEVILGFGGKVIGFLYVGFFLHRTSFLLRQFGEFLTAIPYPETPMIVFIGITALFAAYAVNQGIETICRVGEIVSPIILTSLILIFLMMAKDVDITTLKPFLESGMGPIAYGAFIVAARTTSVMFLPMLSPYINKPDKIKNSMLLALFILTLYFIPITITTIGVFGLEQASKLNFPFYHLVRMVRIGQFLERIDAIFIGFWVLSMFINVAAHYYLTVLGTAQVLKLKDYRYIIAPMGTIIVVVSLIQSDNMIELSEFLSYKVFTWYALIFTFILPLILLFTAILRKKRADIT